MTKTGNDLVHRLLCAAQGEPAGPVPGVHIQTLLREAADEIDGLQAQNQRRYEGTVETFYCPQCRCARCGNTFKTHAVDPGAGSADQA